MRRMPIQAQLRVEPVFLAPIAAAAAAQAVDVKEGLVLRSAPVGARRVWLF